jgi:hypothetical protein
MHGILLFAHGARDPAWATPFHTIAAHMRQESGVISSRKASATCRCCSTAPARTFQAPRSPRPPPSANSTP